MDRVCTGSVWFEEKVACRWRWDINCELSHYLLSVWKKVKRKMSPKKACSLNAFIKFIFKVRQEIAQLILGPNIHTKCMCSPVYPFLWLRNLIAYTHLLPGCVCHNNISHHQNWTISFRFYLRIWFKWKMDCSKLKCTLIMSSNIKHEHAKRK